MGRTDQRCSVCDSPVAAEINKQLAAKVFLRNIAQMCGISKSAIHRHSQKCIPRNRLADFKFSKSAKTGRLLIAGSLAPNNPWDGRLVYYQGPRHDPLIVPPADLLPDDQILTIVWDKPTPPRLTPPRAPDPEPTGVPLDPQTN